jgi:hypothetical protein
MLAVHPDKVGHNQPEADQAAGRVNKVSLWHCSVFLLSAMPGVSCEGVREQVCQ